MQWECIVGARTLTEKAYENVEMLRYWQVKATHRACMLRGMLVMCPDCRTIISRFRSTRVPAIFPLSALPFLPLLSLSPSSSLPSTVLSSSLSFTEQSTPTTNREARQNSCTLQVRHAQPTHSIPIRRYFSKTSSMYSLCPHLPATAQPQAH